MCGIVALSVVVSFHSRILISLIGKKSYKAINLFVPSRGIVGLLNLKSLTFMQALPCYHVC